MLIAPHDDDQTLFAAATCMREQPLVVVVTDSYVQPNRGEVGCSARDRARETDEACRLLGCSVLRVGLRDDMPLADLDAAFRRWLDGCANFECVYAPAVQGGHPHHDLIGHAVLFSDRFSRSRHYTTYTRTELWTNGDAIKPWQAATEVVLTPEEHLRKGEALLAHRSQVRINRPHFDAVLGKNEWLISG